MQRSDDARASQTTRARGTVWCLAVFVFWAALQWDVRAAAAGVADRARSLIAELEASGAARELVGPAVGRAKQALSQAEAASPARAPQLEDTALEWAEVARDLVRASEAERASDALEQEASALATEIARVRAAVEQAMARVGRARQDLKEVEPATPAAPTTPLAATTARPATAPTSAGAAAVKPGAVPAKDGAPTPGAPLRTPAEGAPAARENQ
jgi:ABC-type transporter Mla subunit MlaD